MSAPLADPERAPAGALPSPAEQQLALPTLSEIAFDEMNLSMTPIGVLTNTPPRERQIHLSADGRCRLEATGGPGLPTALADLVVLALMWLTQRATGFREPVIRFELRDLVCNYMFPERYSATYNPGQKILKSVEDQLNRVAFTRIVNDAWHDRRLGKTTRINAALIDYIQVIEEGGKNRRRVLEVRWGEKFYQSILARYTKPIDPQLLAQIEHHLDRRLYRYLDQQLTPKRTQRITSCQDFARGVLVMTGDKIGVGGRTASRYIVKRLEESLHRLDALGFRVKSFRVRLEVDSSIDDFSLTFVRLDDAPNSEVVVEDRPGDLVREFQHQFHGLPRQTKKRRLRDADRRAAERWLETHGFEKAAWMIGRAKQLHERSDRGKETIFYFGGLDRYESAALGAYEHWQNEQRGQLELLLEKDRKAKWETYRSEKLTQAEASLDAEQRATLRQECEAFVRQDMPPGFMIPAVLNRLAEAEMHRRLIERSGALCEEEFYRSLQKESEKP